MTEDLFDDGYHDAVLLRNRRAIRDVEYGKGYDWGLEDMAKPHQISKAWEKRYRERERKSKDGP